MATLAERAPTEVQPAAATRALRKVLVSELEVVASIGVYEHEHRYVQRVIVSLELDVTDDYDGRTDHLGDVYDYDEAIRAVHLTLDEDHINLIETAAERIAQRCLENPRVQTIKVRIEKPDVLTSCRSVGIEIVRAGR
ncbi:MAG: dihydroneopterin aldolase [Pseudomonadota bacterium]